MCNWVKDRCSGELHVFNFWYNVANMNSKVMTATVYYCKLNAISFKMFSIIQSFIWQGEPCCAWTARSWRGWESSRRRWGRRSSNRSSSCRSEKKSVTCSFSAEVSRIMRCTHSGCGAVLRDRVDLGVEGKNRKKVYLLWQTARATECWIQQFCVIMGWVFLLLFFFGAGTALGSGLSRWMWTFWLQKPIQPLIDS